MKAVDLMEKIGLSVFLGTVFLLPIFFLNFTTEYYDFNKNILLITASALMLILTSIKFIIDRQVKFTRSPLTLPIIFVTFTSILSLFLASPNRIEALLSPNQTSTAISLFIFFTLGVGFVKSKRELSLLFYTILFSTTTLALVSIFWSTSIAGKILPASLDSFKSSLWSPTGSILASLIILVSSLPLQIITTVRAKQLGAISAIALFVTLIGCGAIVYNFVNPPTPASRIPLLSQSTGWAIAMDSLKISPVWGTGPATFLSDFTRFRPISYNLTPDWSIRFVNSSSYWLETLSTLGILGISAWVFVFIRTVQLTRKTAKLSSSATAPYAQTYALGANLSALLLLVMLMFLPGNFISVVFIFVYLILAVSAFKQLGTNLVYEANIDLVAASDNSHSPILPWIIFICSLVLIVPSGYFFIRSYAAEIWFTQAITAANKNDGKATFQNLLQAIQLNPNMDNYHIAYSQANLLFANTLASNQNLSDSDRNTITQLIQQAVQEGKNAVALNPNKVTNVENLAGIYRTLLNYAQGADAWTIAAYSNAITLDPANPNYRIALGGVYFTLKNYDQAIALFQQAVNLKPDLANAQYNLAEAYIQKGDWQSAATSLQATLNVLEPASADYQKVTTELDQIKQKLGQANTTQTTPKPASELTKPEPISPKINPPIKLEQSATPSSQPTPNP